MCFAASEREPQRRGTAFVVDLELLSGWILLGLSDRGCQGGKPEFGEWDSIGFYGCDEVVGRVTAAS